MAYKETPVQSAVVEIEFGQRNYRIHTNKLRDSKTVIDTTLPKRVPQIVLREERHSKRIDSVLRIEARNAGTIRTWERSRSTIGRNAVESLSNNPFWPKVELREKRQVNWMGAIVGDGWNDSRRIRASDPNASSVIKSSPGSPNGKKTWPSSREESEVITFDNDHDSPKHTVRSRKRV